MLFECLAGALSAEAAAVRVLAPRAATTAAARAMRWSFRVMADGSLSGERRGSRSCLHGRPIRSPYGLTWVSTLHTWPMSVQHEARIVQGRGPRRRFRGQ